MSVDQALRNLELAKFYFGNCDDGNLLPEDADWTEERVPLAVLASVMEGGVEGWKHWFRDEVACRRADLEDGSGENVIIHWETFAEEETDEPCVIAIGDDGGAQIWDGYHRIAGAFMRGAEEIPAVVGRRKPRQQASPARAM